MKEAKNDLNLSDHDLLIVIYTRQEELIKQFTNHLHHHWAVTIAAVSAGLIGVCSFITVLIISI